MRQLTSTGVTIVVVEQFADIVLDLADTVAVMGQGKVRLSGTPKQVRGEIESAYLGSRR